MYGPLPSWWPLAVRRSHDIAVEATVFDGIVDGGGASLSLDVLSGRVDLDTTRSVARTCTLDLIDRTGTVTPASAQDILAPYGNEIRLRRGITWGTETFLVPLGIFVIDDVDVTETDDGTTIALTGQDRALRIARNRWATPYSISAGTPVDQAIAALLTDRWAAVSLDLTATGDTLPLVVFDPGDSSDPWRDAQNLAASAGMVLDFDPDGVARLRVPPDPLIGDPVATYAPGEASVLLGTGRRLSAEGVYSGVIALGESSSVDTPVRGEAWDDDPSSATFRGGPFGEVPYFYSSPLLLTTDQANKAAATVLQRILGQSERVEWSNIVDPSLDGLDVIHLASDGTRIDAAYVIEALTYPLTAEEPMTGRAQARKLVTT